VKENCREQELTCKEEVKKIAKESGPGLRKRGKALLNNAV